MNNAALVVGGGIAGMTAALALAEQGFPVHLVEKTGELGGTARQMHRTLDGQDVQAFLAETIERVERPPNGSPSISNAHVAKVDGHVGDFTSSLAHRTTVPTASSTGWSSWPPAPRSRSRRPTATAKAAGVLTQLELTDRLGRGDI